MTAACSGRANAAAASAILRGNSWWAFRPFVWWYTSLLCIRMECAIPHGTGRSLCPRSSKSWSGNGMSMRRGLRRTLDCALGRYPSCGEQGMEQMSVLGKSEVYRMHYDLRSW